MKKKKRSCPPLNSNLLFIKRREKSYLGLIKKQWEWLSIFACGSSGERKLTCSQVTGREWMFRSVVLIQKWDLDRSHPWKSCHPWFIMEECWGWKWKLASYRKGECEATRQKWKKKKKNWLNACYMANIFICSNPLNPKLNAPKHWENNTIYKTQ